MSLVVLTENKKAMFYLKYIDIDIDIDRAPTVFQVLYYVVGFQRWIWQHRCPCSFEDGRLSQAVNSQT